jgi:hypothetical protein
VVSLALATQIIQKTFAVTSFREIELRHGEEAMKAIGPPNQTGSCPICGWRMRFSGS